MALILLALGALPADPAVELSLDNLKPAELIEPRARVAPFDVPRRERGGRRIDPAAERRRLRTARRGGLSCPTC